MAERFRIELYSKSDRDSVFDLIRAANPNFAPALIRNWEWKYDANPFNREAACYRRARHEELSAFLRTIRSAERIDNFARRWGLTKPEDLAPQRDDEPYILLVKKDSDEVVGMEGSVPQLFLVNGKEHWTSVECDLAVHPAYRNRGLTHPLGNRIRMDNAVCFSWYTVATQRIMSNWRKASLHRIGTPESHRTAERRVVPWVKPIDWGVLASRVTGSRMVGRAAALLGASTHLLRWAFSRPVSVPGVRVVRIDSFGQGIDQLCREASCDYAVMALRDQRYLNWRFVSRPDASYTRIAAIRDSRTLGYLVFRIADNFGVPCGFLVDYLVEGRSTAIFALLLQHAEECLLSENVKVIVCSVTSPPYRSVLLRHGFYPAALRMRCYLVAAVHSSDPGLQVFTDLREWFLTMGDGNLEMSF
ncbi:MAG: GNAT family N-acetyltransferase [Candidatus Binataceae bacterium]